MELSRLHAPARADVLICRRPDGTKRVRRPYVPAETCPSVVTGPRPPTVRPTGRVRGRAACEAAADLWSDNSPSSGSLVRMTALNRPLRSVGQRCLRSGLYPPSYWLPWSLVVPARSTTVPRAIWTVASKQHIDAGTSEFTVLTSRLGCNSGVNGSVVPPYVELDDEQVIPTLRLSRAGRPRQTAKATIKFRTRSNSPSRLVTGN